MPSRYRPTASLPSMPSETRERAVAATVGPFRCLRRVQRPSRSQGFLRGPEETLRWFGVDPCPYFGADPGTGCSTGPRPCCPHWRVGARRGVIGGVAEGSSGGDLVEDPGVLEGRLPPALVAPADAAVAGHHLRLQQDRPVAAAGADLAQRGHPFGGLDEEDARVVEAGGGQDRRVGLR